MPVRYARRRGAASSGPRPDPPPAGTAPAEPRPVSRRSHAAAAVAIGVVALGAWLGTWTILVPILLGLWLLSTGWTFLGARVNPLSLGFYLTVKPSWTAVAVVFLSGLLLLALAYDYYRTGLGPLLPRHLVPW